MAAARNVVICSQWWMGLFWVLLWDHDYFPTCVIFTVWNNLGQHFSWVLCSGFTRLKSRYHLETWLEKDPLSDSFALLTEFIDLWPWWRFPFSWLAVGPGPSACPRLLGFFHVALSTVPQSVSSKPAGEHLWCLELTDKVTSNDQEIISFWLSQSQSVT